ncbi:Cytochrome c biogenesis ATP-binding export protein CcmA [invertebrate metagenome]|uniref:Cytochrome c biogenesis ATP-binding export protein CcmA n=1 Tax=invertebrate metagenome TaxID=1711999 RepID=A0A2H9T5Q7_9ZZZZ
MLSNDHLRNSNQAALFQVDKVSASPEGYDLFLPVSFALCQGDIIQVEGRNGVGKTTLLRLLAGISVVDSGGIIWKQHSIYRVRQEFYRCSCFISHEPAVQEHLTSLENLQWRLGLKGEIYRRDQLLEALVAAGIESCQDVIGSVLSEGQRRRTALASLMLSQAQLWILDEPYTALDSGGVDWLTACIRKFLSGGGIVIVTSHQSLSSYFPIIKTIRLEHHQKTQQAHLESGYGG